MGTRLLRRGLDLAADDAALWNLTHPEEVLAIHQRDIDAGADAVLTNTFGASRPNLARFGRETDVRAINRAAVALARSAAGPRRTVLGSIGPAGTVFLDDFVEQADALLDAGADGLLLETHAFRTAADGSLEPILASVKAPVAVSLFDWPFSVDLESVALRLLASGACALGLNCQADLHAIANWAERIRRVTDTPLLLKPSAGLPGEPPHPPAALFEWLSRLLPVGRLIVGGCCGTTEEHIAAMRAAIDHHESPVRAPLLHPDLVQ